nr:MAG TPA: hypothetical protein [Caudoviricetes sp.]
MLVQVLGSASVSTEMLYSDYVFSSYKDFVYMYWWDTVMPYEPT